VSETFVWKGLMKMNLFSEKGVIGEAHGKIILVGEHAVVYGKAAIAIPFPLKIRAKIMKSLGEITISSLLYTGTLDGMPKEMKGVSECIRKALELLGKPLKDLNIKLISEIPMGRGLGSSASSATAIARGIYAYFGKEISQKELFFIVELAEAYAHGKPSGIDMMAVASDSPILFTKQEGARSIKASGPFYIVVADTGRIGDTRAAVEQVKKTQLLETNRINDAIDRIEEITEKSHQAILMGDSATLGHLLNKNHEELKELGVSNELLDQLVERAIRSRAMGAKLTGGGMGGCMIALAKDMKDAKNISKELLKGGATKVWYFSTDSEVLYTPYDSKGGEIS
jgi:mevalonate kinase